MGNLEGQKTCYCVDQEMLAALGATVADLIGQSSLNRRNTCKNRRMWKN